MYEHSFICDQLEKKGIPLPQNESTKTMVEIWREVFSLGCVDFDHFLWTLAPLRSETQIQFALSKLKEIGMVEKTAKGSYHLTDFGMSETEAGNYFPDID